MENQAVSETRNPESDDTTETHAADNDDDDNEVEEGSGSEGSEESVVIAAEVVSPDNKFGEDQHPAATGATASNGVKSPVEKQDTEDTKEDGEQSEAENEAQEVKSPASPPPSPEPQQLQQYLSRPVSLMSETKQSPLYNEQHLGQDTEETLIKAEIPLETADSEEENIGSVSDEENFGSDMLEEYDTHTTSPCYMRLPPPRREKVSLTETDELLLNLEDGHSIISDIFEEAESHRRKSGAKILLDSPSPSQLKKLEKPQFSTKAYKSSRSPVSHPAAFDYKPQSYLVIKTPVGYYLDDDEAQVSPLTLPP